MAGLTPLRLDRPALFDTGTWTWVRDRRFPELPAWFNAAVETGQVLVCDLVILELTRLAPNRSRAHEIVTLVHFDRDYQRIGAVSGLRQVPDGTLA